jgi:ATP-dependent helicase/nuclease subunit B
MPSPLIVNLSEFTGIKLQSTLTTTLLVRREDDYSLPLRAFETVAGGTSLLANQAKCPFRAFTAHRLHATSEPKLSTGPDAGERGQILHRIMELLWQQIGSQKALNILSPAELSELIEAAIHSALVPYIHNRQLSFSSLVQDVEICRLRRLITTCLDWDKQRPAFVIESLEKTYTINLAGIDFRVRIDRMDKLASDKKWVIDYKTSLPVVKPWNEDRPEAPQLLLYALLDQSINALLFIQLKAGRLTCNGLSEDALPIKGVSGLKKNERWSDHQQQWHQQLTDIAQEFGAGYCPPSPSRASTCEQCDFQNLCRI